MSTYYGALNPDADTIVFDPVVTFTANNPATEDGCLRGAGNDTENPPPAAAAYPS